MTTISALLACLLLVTAPTVGQSREEPPLRGRPAQP